MIWPSIGPSSSVLLNLAHIIRIIQALFRYLPVEPSESKSKQVSWRIPESLRHRLLSHAEYLSVEKETSTESMVAEWLEEKLAAEEKKRALRTLGIEEKDVPKRTR